MRLLLILALGAIPELPAQPLRFAMVPEAVALERLRRIERGENGPRHDLLRTIFEEAGCKTPDLEDEKVKGSKLPNFVCTLAGESGADIILVTAHFDKVRAGEGPQTHVSIHRVFVQRGGPGEFTSVGDGSQEHDFAEHSGDGEYR